MYDSPQQLKEEHMFGTPQFSYGKKSLEPFFNDLEVKRLNFSYDAGVQENTGTGQDLFQKHKSSENFPIK